MTDLSTTEVSSAPEPFGARLQQARQAKNLSLSEVSSELFILERHLQALEEESFDGLPQPAFARGFVINYAKFLGLDSAEIAQGFDDAYPKNDSLPTVKNNALLLQPMGKLPRQNYSRMHFNPLLIISAIALVVLIVFLFRMMSSASQNSEVSSTMSDELSVSEQTQGAAINKPLNGYQTNEIGASGSALNLDGNGSIDNSSLELILTDMTTINITDATGNSLIEGGQARGSYKLVGKPPFKIDIDNIDNVSVLLNQEPVSLAPYATDKQARFELAL